MRNGLHLIIFIIISMFYITCSSKAIEPHVKGGFKKLDVYKYRYQDGKIDIDSKTQEYSEKYNEQGLTIEESWKDENGKIESRNTYKYDDNGFLIEWIRFKPWKKKGYRTIFKNDEHGNLIWSDDGYRIGRIKNIYDDNNNLIETITFKPDSSIDYKWCYKFDERGNKIAEMSIDSLGKISRMYSFIYDENNNLIIKHKHSTDSSVVYTETFEYNDIGNNIKAIGSYSSGEVDYKAILKYDNKGNRIEVLVYKKNEEFKDKWTFKYDIYGNCIEDIEFFDFDEPGRKQVSIYSK